MSNKRKKLKFASKNPHNFFELGYTELKSLVTWIRSFPPFQQATIFLILIATLLIVAFAFARSGLINERSREIATKLWPNRIPFLDTKRVDIFISLNFDVDSKGAKKLGRLGEFYHTGDIINLEISTNTKCWLLVFCVDSNGIHDIYREGYRPGLFAGGEQKLTQSFALDQTTGPEIYYAIASYEEFSFQSDILPHIVKVEDKIRSKGPDYFITRLDLPQNFYQSSVYFYHR